MEVKLNAKPIYQSLLSGENQDNEPDTFRLNINKSNQIIRPRPTFVISRKSTGEVLSRYRDDHWDLTPYKTTPNASKIYFLNWGNNKGIKFDKLVEEYKWILFTLMYMSRGLRTGYLSVGTLKSYAYLVKNLCIHAQEMDITLHDLFNDENILVSFYKNTASPADCANLTGLLRHIHQLGYQRSGFKVMGCATIDELYRRKRNLHTIRQTPVIPNRIYINILNGLHEIIEEFICAKGALLDLLKKASMQKGYGRLKSSVRQHFPGERFVCNFEEALKKHKLLDYARKHKTTNLIQLTNHVIMIQHACKYLIHAYTGMRSSEAFNLKYHCLHNETSATGKVIQIIGDTSKLVGVKQSTRWLAPSNIQYIIEAAQSITSMIAVTKGFKLKECPLFISIAYLGVVGKIDNDNEILCSKLKKASNPISLLGHSVLIQKEDIEELNKIDPTRNWGKEELFKVGKTWPLTTHQLRRSLAVYIAQSGLVALPSLKRQLKHITHQMTLYYARGSSEAARLFGESKDHFRFDIERAKPNADTLAYMYDVLLSDEPLQGVHGKWVEKFNKPSGKTKILKNREITLKRFKNGELAYQETPLGGCTTILPCDKQAMRSVAACIQCDKAVIKPDKLTKVIESQGNFVNTLDKRTMIYRSEVEMLNDLKRLQKKEVV